MHTIIAICPGSPNLLIKWALVLGMDYTEPFDRAHHFMRETKNDNDKSWNIA